jgi:hypothetical protein
MAQKKSPQYRVIKEIGGARLFSGTREKCLAYIKENGYTLEYASSVHPHFYVS